MFPRPRFPLERSHGFLQLVRLDRQHSQEHWRPPRGSDQDGHAPDDSFRRVYDLFIFLALAFSVLEALMFRLGKRWLLRTAHGQSLGQDGELSSEPLKSLLDDDDLQEAGWYKGNENTQRVSNKKIHAGLAHILWANLPATSMAIRSACLARGLSSTMLSSVPLWMKPLGILRDQCGQ